ncbi:hypothetical protein X907_2144 [Glycocaulis alkaliphilus]|uniref:Uncharacterized protein n=1 Tax=Glycocaulis alkaliphilus TaxID=1434191 RepID=A0A3T0EB14_9PROT|nr:hypothetical protein X907_2144 [Glycocaulis alkaliphilus]
MQEVEYFDVPACSAEHDEVHGRTPANNFAFTAHPQAVQTPVERGWRWQGLAGVQQFKPISLHLLRAETVKCPVRNIDKRRDGA